MDKTCRNTKAADLAGVDGLHCKAQGVAANAINIDDAHLRALLHMHGQGTVWSSQHGIAGFVPLASRTHGMVSTQQACGPGHTAQ